MTRYHRSRSSLLLLACALALLVSVTADAKKPGVEPLPENLVLETLDGERISMGDLRGKVVLFDFWATWCKPCLMALPDLRRLVRRLEGKPFVLISISVDHDEEALRAAIEEEEMTWSQVWDRGGRLASSFGVSTFPFYLVVDHEGRPAAKLDGWSSTHGRTLARAVGREVKSAVRAARKAGRE